MGMFDEEDQSSFYTFIKACNITSGLVAYATLIVMLNNGDIRISKKIHPRFFIRLMVYFDCVAFLFFYISFMASDGLDTCGVSAFLFLAEFTWAFKDAFKFGYIAWRASAIAELRKAKLISYVVALGSLLLYGFYMIMNYSFSGECDNPIISRISDSNWPAIVLYLYWFMVDVVSGGLLLHKLFSAQKATTSIFTNQTRSKYRQLIKKEAIRLGITVIGMSLITIITILSIAKVIDLPINSTVFVYLQLVLYLSSMKIADDKPPDTTQTNQRGTQETRSGAHDSPQMDIHVSSRPPASFLKMHSSTRINRQGEKDDTEFVCDNNKAITDRKSGGFLGLPDSTATLTGGGNVILDIPSESEHV